MKEKKILKSKFHGPCEGGSQDSADWDNGPRNY